MVETKTGGQPRSYHPQRGPRFVQRADVPPSDRPGRDPTMTIRAREENKDTGKALSAAPRVAKGTMLLVALAMTLGIVGFAPTSASATSGSVTCAKLGSNNVVGVWVDVQNGRDGWARRSYTSENSNFWNYNTQGKPYRLFIGSGGSPQRWETSTAASWTRGQRNATVVNRGNYSRLLFWMRPTIAIWA